MKKSILTLKSILKPYLPNTQSNSHHSHSPPTIISRNCSFPRNQTIYSIVKLNPKIQPKQTTPQQRTLSSSYHYSLKTFKKFNFSKKTLTSRLEIKNNHNNTIRENIPKKVKFNKIKPPPQTHRISRAASPKNDTLALEQQKLEGFKEQYLEDLEKQRYHLFKSPLMRRVINLKENQFIPRQKGKERFKRIRILIRELLEKLNRLKINRNEFYTQIIFSTKIYQKKYSQEFIKYTKLNQIDKVQSLLEYNKYLVYDFDNLLMTALHWSVKRGFYTISELLLINNADPNMQDIIGRTPLYLAIEQNDPDLVQLLLYHRANPWSVDQCDYSLLLQENPQLSAIVSKSRKIDITLAMTPIKKRQQIWMRKKKAFHIDLEV